MNTTQIKNELEASKVQSGKYTGIGANTIKTYMDKLNYILKNHETLGGLVSFICENWTSENTILSYLTAMIGIAKHSPTFEKLISGEIESLKKRHLELSEKKSGAPKQVKTEKEAENWITLKDLIKKINETELTDQDRLLAGIYTLIPPSRLDYNSVKIVKNSFVNEETGLPEGIVQSENFVQLYKKNGRWKSVMHLQEYKTAETYGTNTFDLPKKITDLILKLPEDQVYLFEKRGNGHKPFSDAKTFGVYLGKLFKGITGKQIGVDILRHIYITHFRKGEKSQAKKEQVAKVMGHSVATQDEYIKLK